MKIKSIILLFLLLFVISVSGCKKRERTFCIGILQWTEKIESFNETRQGFIDGLKESGYIEEKNLTIFYKNAEQDTETAQDALQEFMEKEVDVIVALGTGSTIVSFERIRKNKIPMVYSILGDTKAIERTERYNMVKDLVTGVTMKVSINAKFRHLKELLPDMKNIGILYCSQMPEAVTTGDKAFEEVNKTGLNPVRVVIDIEELNKLKYIVKELLSKVDVLYIPTDPVLSIPENFSIIINSADSMKKPVVSVSYNSVLNGALFAMHSDFYHLGKQTTYPVIKIFEGISPLNIDLQDPAIVRTSLNLKKAELLGIKIPRNVAVRTDNFIQ